MALSGDFNSDVISIILIKFLRISNPNLAGFQNQFQWNFFSFFNEIFLNLTIGAIFKPIICRSLNNLPTSKSCRVNCSKMQKQTCCQGWARVPVFASARSRVPDILGARERDFFTGTGERGTRRVGTLISNS